MELLASRPTQPTAWPSKPCPLAIFCEPWLGIAGQRALGAGVGRVGDWSLAAGQPFLLAGGASSALGPRVHFEPGRCSALVSGGRAKNPWLSELFPGWRTHQEILDPGLGWRSIRQCPYLSTGNDLVVFALNANPLDRNHSRILMLWQTEKNKPLAAPEFFSSTNQFKSDSLEKLPARMGAHACSLLYICEQHHHALCAPRHSGTRLAGWLLPGSQRPAPGGSAAGHRPLNSLSRLPSVRCCVSHDWLWRTQV